MRSCEPRHFDIAGARQRDERDEQDLDEDEAARPRPHDLAVASVEPRALAWLHKLVVAGLVVLAPHAMIVVAGGLVQRAVVAWRL